ncbi:flagellar hook-basal body complex protein FliE [Glaciecola sp. 1036]|uniref:flagellar hook-basal body complex protein FliE n=1 Tax=Alteromonadaceae TaxID=72275 RepID=UPI003D0754E3
MEINASSLYQEMQSMVAEISSQSTPLQRVETNPSKAEFSDMLNQALDGVNGLQHTSRDLQRRFEMGDPDLSLVDVMVAKEKSGIAFEATIQVRNKVLEAYKTIMNMPV